MKKFNINFKENVTWVKLYGSSIFYLVSSIQESRKLIKVKGLSGSFQRSHIEKYTNLSKNEKSKSKKNEVIELNTYEGLYGYEFTEAIVLHKRYGLIYICNSFGYDEDGNGYVRWCHGAAIKLKKGETLESLIKQNRDRDGMNEFVNSYRHDISSKTSKINLLKLAQELNIV